MTMKTPAQLESEVARAWEEWMRSRPDGENMFLAREALNLLGDWLHARKVATADAGQCKHAWRDMGATSTDTRIYWCPVCGCVWVRSRIAGGDSYLAPGIGMHTAWLMQPPTCRRS